MFARHALPSVVDASLAPAAIFWVVLRLVGFKGALIAALAWSCLAAVRRLVRRERVPAVLALGLGLLGVRTAVSLVTGSAFIYFAQPTAATAGVALVFMASAFIRRPLVERLAHDFCPLDPDVMGSAVVRRFFLRVSLLWGMILLVNAGFVLWLLVRTSLAAFVWERTMVTWVLMGGGIVLSTLWFIRTLKGAGITVRFGGASAAAAPGCSSGQLPTVAVPSPSADSAAAVAGGAGTDPPRGPAAPPAGVAPATADLVSASGD